MTAGLSQPLPGGCRADHYRAEGAFTFTANGTAIVRPNPRVQPQRARHAAKPADRLAALPYRAHGGHGYADPLQAGTVIGAF